MEKVREVISHISLQTTLEGYRHLPHPTLLTKYYLCLHLFACVLELRGGAVPKGGNSEQSIDTGTSTQGSSNCLQNAPLLTLQPSCSSVQLHPSPKAQL